jgi:hypothetical protein
MISFATLDLYLQYLHVQGNGVYVAKSFEQNIFLNRYFCTENSVQSDSFCSVWQVCYVYCGEGCLCSVRYKVQLWHLLRYCPKPGTIFCNLQWLIAEIYYLKTFYKLQIHAVSVYRAPGISSVCLGSSTLMHLMLSQHLWFRQEGVCNITGWPDTPI